MNNIPTLKDLWERKQQQIVKQRNQYKKVPTIGEILEEKLGQKKKEVNKQQSAERVSSIEIPPVLEKLITGSDYWVKAKTNRYKMLIRQGYLQDLLDLAEMAQRKDNPANWFACVCSVKMWERTLTFLKKCRKVIQTATEVAKRLQTEVTSFILKQVWHCPKAEYYATQAAEIGRDKMKLFAWFCLNQI